MFFVLFVFFVLFPQHAASKTPGHLQNGRPPAEQASRDEDCRCLNVKMNTKTTKLTKDTKSAVLTWKASPGRSLTRA